MNIAEEKEYEYVRKKLWCVSFQLPIGWTEMAG